MIRAILLDLDGTLVASTDAHAQSWVRTLARFGYDVSLEAMWRWIGMGGDKLLKQVDPVLSDESEPGKSISKCREEMYMSEYVGSLQPTNGARELLERLGEEKMLRVIASSAKTNELQAALKTAGLQGLVDLTTDAQDAEHSKPDPDIIGAALKKARVRPEEALYIGDTPYDIVAAHKAGVVAVAVACGAWDAHELADAERVYRDPAEIVERFASLF